MLCTQPGPAVEYQCLPFRNNHVHELVFLVVIEAYLPRKSVSSVVLALRLIGIAAVPSL